MSGPVLNLELRHFTRELGDLTVIGSWYGADLESSEPVLVLLPTYRMNSIVDGVGVRVKPCCVALSAAYLYDEPAHLAYMATKFSIALGMETSTYKIASAIYDHLLDLIKMPPKPVSGSRQGAEAIVTDGWGNKKTIELRKDY